MRQAIIVRDDHQRCVATAAESKQKIDDLAAVYRKAGGAERATTPSAADLDAVADEDQARTATASKENS